MTPPREPRNVLLLNVPLDVYARAVQWHADLMREFALITIGEASGTARDDAGDGVTVAGRLLDVVTELRGRYEALTTPAVQQLWEAHRRGEESADVAYRLPAEAAEDVQHLGELLDEVDEFSRSGELLILAAPCEVAAFRRWLLDEFARQLGGADPTPWPTWARSDA